MEFKETVDILKKSKEFDIAEGLFLAHGFTTLDKDWNAAEPWHIGFYNKTTDKMTTFSVTEHVIEKMEDQEVFRKPETVIQELKIDDVKIDFDKAVELLKELHQEKYKLELPTKVIVLLQIDSDLGITWNFTIVSASLKTINIKISALHTTARV